MNLEQALNYHSHCILCKAEMDLKSPDLAGIRMIIDEYGIQVASGHKDISVCFNFDGTYHKMKRWNNLYVKPMSILKECPNCTPTIEVDGVKQRIQYKPRSLGYTTLMQSRDIHFAYQFSLRGDDAGHFEVKLDWEDIKFYTRKNFYHFNTKFEQNQTFLILGTNAERQEATVESMSYPAISTASVSDSEQLLNKLKLYNVFS